MKNVICQKCGQHPATVFYRENKNGKEKEFRLCAACAKELGMEGLQDDFFSLPLFSLFGEREQKEERCPLCGTTLSAIRKNGLFGCSNCYDTFASRLDLSPYVGKGSRAKPLTERTFSANKEPVPQKEKEEKKEESLQALKQALQEAIKGEEYEKAAALRDKIRAREGM